MQICKRSCILDLNLPSCFLGKNLAFIQGVVLYLQQIDFCLQNNGARAPPWLADKENRPLSPTIYIL